MHTLIPRSKYDVDITLVVHACRAHVSLYEKGTHNGSEPRNHLSTVPLWQWFRLRPQFLPFVLCCHVQKAGDCGI
ncbi:hypothetical protein LshimejAT787_0311730 [Lyophyllum shimeji]|uniref:Uncharacterized protein n=1 Tax=Lyophyllum shimeji TaxID=47721 RepID=A0A9P3PK62_LYOSH|nr:hypothetical protein LshimejAT787_0311730 [Lyophyllum shimeji]